MGGKLVSGGAFAHTLRVSLYSEHLDLPIEEVEDPLDPDFNNKLNLIAEVSQE